MNKSDTDKPAVIQLVDDMPENLKVLRKILAEQGYGIRTSINGTLALRSAHEDPPDLILLDIRMPGMDGYEVCRELKADESTRDIPVIFISALDETEDKVKAFSFGGVDFITKPFQEEEVLARVRTHLGIRELQRGLQKEIADRTLAEKAALKNEETARMALKTLHERTEELERSNMDLEQFAYAISHDLTEPLRMVSSYVKLLERRYKGKLDSDADDFIAFAVDGAVRMHTLLKEMLAFSRVGTRGKPFGPVEAEHILEQTLTDLSVSIRESGAVVTHDALPRVIADASQLARVFQNLIANAVKFRGEEPPRIHITAEKNDGEWVFSFKDNGIGIAPKYSDRIFVIFQRLHTREEYPGTGMGLAMCKKIVERHAGRLWVESREGAGSTFYFTIPIKEENGYEYENK
ncbi:response regulator [Desulfobacterales bacterium HSG2]|nr:response regulator [Desulfobacterales bacterium HSG2]